MSSCQASVGDTERGQWQFTACVQLPGQSGWQGMRSVAVHCLHQFVAALLVSQQPFAYRTDHISQLSIMLWKTMQKTDIFFVVVMIVVNQFPPLALSQLTMSRLLKKVNKPARNLQIPVEVWDLTGEKCLLPWRVPSSRMLKVVLLSVGLAQNSAAGTRSRISTR